MALTEKAFLEIEGSASTIPCMFNPAELAVSRTNSWAGNPIAGKGVPQVKYLGAASGAMALHLTFDTTDTGDAVTRHTGKVLTLMDVDPSLPGTDPQTNNARPPYVIFHWGNLHSFKAVVSNTRPAVHLFLLDRRPAASEGGFVADPVLRIGGVRAAESDVRHARPAPRAPGPAGRDAGPDLRQVLRRLHPLAIHRPAQRHCRPVGIAGGLPALDSPVDHLSTPLGTIAPVIKVSGRPLSELALMQLDDLRISRMLRLPARAALRFSDIGYAIAAGQIFEIGTQVEISAPDGTALFVGEVTGAEMTLDHGQPEFTVVADDSAYKLTLGTKVRTFTMVSYAEVIGQIAGEHGLQKTVTGLSSPRQDYLLQADSDFGFLSEIADRSGCDWWIDGKTLVFQPFGQAPSAVTLKAEEDLDSFSVRASALHPGTATIKGWWPKTKQSVSADGAKSRNGANAHLVEPFLTAANLQSASQTISTADMPGDQEEANTLADRLMERWTAGAVTAKGSCPANAAITPGGSVTIEGAGPASGTYQVSEVEHSYSSHGFRTRFTAGDRRLSGLVDLLSGSHSSSFRRDGLVVGIVTTVGNSQGSAGDIKVKYSSLGGDVESNWARIVTLGAGAKRGMTFLPEVNDEVIVGFEGGDARRPVILGGVYNGKDVPVEFGVQNGNVSQAPDHLPARPFRRTGRRHRPGQPAHRAQPGRREAPGPARQGSAGRAGPGGHTDHGEVRGRVDRDRPGRVDHPVRPEDHPEVEDRRRDHRAQHHREGERQGGHLRNHDGDESHGHRRGVGRAVR